MLKWLLLAIYVLLCIYLGWRTAKLLRRVSDFFNKQTYVFTMVLYIALSSAMVVAAFLPDSGFQRCLKHFSTIWYGCFIYLLFFTLCSDILVLVLKLFFRKFYKEKFRKPLTFFIMGLCVVGLSASLCIGGAVHGRNLQVKEDTVTISKPLEEHPLKIVLAADLHMGHTIRSARIQAMVDAINAQDPDLVVFAGDMFNNDYDEMEDVDDLIASLSQLKSRYGVYGVFGNHDVNSLLIGGFTISDRQYAVRDSRYDTFLEKAGITMLKDDYVLINDEFYLVGRLDGEVSGYGESVRSPLYALMARVDEHKPVFVINHEPDDFEEAEAYGVDIMFSGHTHAGQFFPLTITSPFCWDNDWGMVNYGTFTSIVTSGVGLYGPDMRVGTDCEIRVVTVYGTDS